jgi:hypothetical protein
MFVKELGDTKFIVAINDAVVGLVGLVPAA